MSSRRELNFHSTTATHDQRLGVEAAMPVAQRTISSDVCLSLNPELSARRRKVRKGTKSCWECKRRKIRCIFASSEDVTCVNCERRRTACVSQELPEDLSPAKKGNRHLGDRIRKVEDFMKDFLTGNDVDSASQMGRQSGRDRRPSSDAIQARLDTSAPPSVHSPLTPAESHEESISNASLFTPDLHSVSGQRGTDRILHHLLAALPAENDVKILLRESCRISRYTSLINTQPHSKLTLETLMAPYSLAELPGPNTHPITLAKLMIIFALTLQSSCAESLTGLSEPQSVLMHRLMTATTTWVTTKEETHGTVESLICIILEGVFEINCGNLRHAWSVYRRAMTVAQLMGLHRSPIPPLRRIEPALDVEPEFLWFRIVYLDRYLSLLLGLPQGTSDRGVGALSTLRDEPPLGRFERQLNVIASRILERNETAFATTEIMTTQSIDSELLRVSKSMPLSFWRPGNFHSLTPGSPDALLETLRLGAQVYYYGLLVQLHLPYMMRIDENISHEYSKVTCLNASREIITRFIAHRTFNPISSCSRPVDFFTLLAVMTLLLAHLESHHHYQDTTSLLAHQRLSDRAMLDQALERMDVISNMNKDLMTEKSAELIRQLLEFEADAAEGSSYTARSVMGDGDSQESRKEEKGLSIHVPYLGFIKISRQDSISRDISLRNTAAPSHQASQTTFLQREPFTAPDDSFTNLPHVQPINEQSLSNLPAMVQSSSFSRLLVRPEQSNIQLEASGLEQGISRYPESGYDDITLQPHVELPSIAVAANDWALQGVDAAFFDTLTRGTSCELPIGLRQQWFEDSLNPTTAQIGQEVSQ